MKTAVELAGHFYASNGWHISADGHLYDPDNGWWGRIGGDADLAVIEWARHTATSE